MTSNSDLRKQHEVAKQIGSATGDAMWKQIDDLVVRWAKRNPRAANWNRIYNQRVRDEGKDKKFSEWKDDKGKGLGTRSTISVHPELVNFIEVFFPKFFESKENVRKFGKIYKMFRIPDKM